jgi:hypothetical protein
MKGITTLAALPNGAGQAAALPAETVIAVDLAKGPDTCAVRVGDTITYYVDGEVVMVATLGAACREECPK